MHYHNTININYTKNAFNRRIIITLLLDCKNSKIKTIKQITNGSDFSYSIIFRTFANYL